MTLVEELQKLWAAAGYPSSRTLADRADNGASHSSINKIMRGQPGYHPRWSTVETVAELLGGDVKHIKQLWIDEHLPNRPARTSATDDAPKNEIAEAIRANTAAIKNLTAAIERNQATP